MDRISARRVSGNDRHLSSKKMCNQLCDAYETFVCFSLYASFCIVSLAKGKGEIVPVHTMMAYGGSRDIAPHICNFGTIWR